MNDGSLPTVVREVAERALQEAGVALKHAEEAVREADVARAMIRQLHAAAAGVCAAHDACVRAQARRSEVEATWMAAKDEYERLQRGRFDSFVAGQKRDAEEEFFRGIDSEPLTEDEEEISALYDAEIRADRGACVETDYLEARAARRALATAQHDYQLERCAADAECVRLADALVQATAAYEALRQDDAVIRIMEGFAAGLPAPSCCPPEDEELPIHDKYDHE